MIMFKTLVNNVSTLVKLTTDSVEGDRKFVANREKALEHLRGEGYTVTGAVLALVKY